MQFSAPSGSELPGSAQNWAPLTFDHVLACRNGRQGGPGRGDQMKEEQEVTEILVKSRKGN
jgi:hypothetical protein